MRKLMLALVFLAGCGGAGNQKYSISWNEPVYGLARGETKTVFSRGEPKIQGKTLIYIDWDTGAKITMNGNSFEIQRSD